MRRILCSTGCCIGRPNGRDYRLLAKLAPQLDCDGFEFMMYDSWYGEVDALTAFLRSLQRPIPVVHCEKRIGELISLGEDMDEALRRFEINCALAQQLGADRLVVHLWDGLTSDRRFHNNLAAYPTLRDIAGAHGLELLVENVVCSIADPMQRRRELLAVDPVVRFVFDTKMAAFHGQLEQLFAPENAWLWQEGHIRHFHMNDYAGGYKDWENLRTLPIGTGHIDWPQMFEFLDSIGYDGTLTVESTAFDRSGAVDTEMLNRQFRLLRAAGFK